MLLPVAITAALGYSLICLGFLPKGVGLAYNRLGDYSYGTYLYAFPVQQAMAHLVPGATPIGNMLLAFPVTLLFAVLSWHLIEERALKRLRASPAVAPAPASSHPAQRHADRP